MNSHWSRGNKMKQEWQEVVCWAIATSPLKGKHFDKPVFVTYYFYEPNKRRDQSNIEAFAVKVIEDALQEMKVLNNDNWKWMKGHAAYFDIDSDNPRIEVEIEEVEN